MLGSLWIDLVQLLVLKEIIFMMVEFLEEDEFVGEILVGFFGSNCVDFIVILVLIIFFIYLCGLFVFIFENIMVECEEFVSLVLYWWDMRLNFVIWFQFIGVVIEKFEFVEKWLFELF